MNPSASTDPDKPQPLGVQHEVEIFAKGLAKLKPQVPVAFQDLKQQAREKMRPEAFGYVSGNAGAGDTARANRSAFEHWQMTARASLAELKELVSAVEEGPRFSSVAR